MNLPGSGAFPAASSYYPNYAPYPGSSAPPGSPMAGGFPGGQMVPGTNGPAGYQSPFAPGGPLTGSPFPNFPPPPQSSSPFGSSSSPYPSYGPSPYGPPGMMAAGSSSSPYPSYGGNPNSPDFHAVLDSLVRNAGVSPTGAVSNDQDVAASSSITSKGDTPVFSFKKLYSFPFYLSTDNGGPSMTIPYMKQHIRRMSQGLTGARVPPMAGGPMMPPQMGGPPMMGPNIPPQFNEPRMPMVPHHPHHHPMEFDPQVAARARFQQMQALAQQQQLLKALQSSDMIASYLQKAIKDPQSLSDDSGIDIRDMIGGKKSMAEKLAAIESYREKEKDTISLDSIRDRDSIRETIRESIRDNRDNRDSGRNRDHRDWDSGPSSYQGSRSSGSSSSVSDAMDSQEMAETQSRPSFVAYYDPIAATGSANPVHQHQQQQQPVYQFIPTATGNGGQGSGSGINPSRSGSIYSSSAAEDTLSGSETSNSDAIIILPPPGHSSQQSSSVSLQQSPILSDKSSVTGFPISSYHGSVQQQQPTLSSVTPGLKTGAFVTFGGGSGSVKPSSDSPAAVIEEPTVVQLTSSYSMAGNLGSGINGITVGQSPSSRTVNGITVRRGTVH